MDEKKYIRDKRSPEPKNSLVSRVMSANKQKNTKPEILLRKILWESGIRGYRLHWKKIPGRPDLAFVKRKIAVFINGCFWHRCPNCHLPDPKTNTTFWMQKFENNIKRDKKKVKDLEDLGWNTFTIWECEIKSDPIILSSKLKKILNK